MPSAQKSSPKKIAKLVQSPKEEAVVVTLKKDEVGMLSSDMNVLWKYDDDTKSYKKMRGHHAGGGPGNLDWEALLEGVPSGAGTQIVTSCHKNDYDLYIGKVKRALKKDLDDFQAKRKFLDFTNVYVTRNGKAKDIDDNDYSDEKKFTVRNKDKRMII